MMWAGKNVNCERSSSRVGSMLGEHQASCHWKGEGGPLLLLHEIQCCLLVLKKPRITELNQWPVYVALLEGFHTTL